MSAGFSSAARRVFVDTSAYFALLDSRDARHTAAQAASSEIPGGCIRRTTSSRKRMRSSSRGSAIPWLLHSSGTLIAAINSSSVLPRRTSGEHARSSSGLSTINRWIEMPELDPGIVRREAPVYPFLRRVALPVPCVNLLGEHRAILDPPIQTLPAEYGQLDLRGCPLGRFNQLPCFGV